ncbi:MAG TPA: trypsin-like peptidase domain-containing protein [Candidatus Methylomirabilis sp.]|nr:trypsin-like peptidase domain-containing protein [Candidatus Methylomirabilis sp.]
MAVADFGEVSEKLRRSTVLIHCGDRGSGSGLIWQSDGLILTNAHVARGARTCVQLWDGREFEAAVISRDPRADLAALRVEALDLPSVEVADCSKLRPGELAIAIGNPLGFVGALTTGVIHAIGPLRGFGSRHWVQANVRLAPGNSGGPLADARGRLIGINTMVAGRLALAVPSNTVSQFLVTGPGDAWFGVALHAVRVPRRGGNGLGLVILEVEPQSPAERASLLPGDILLGTEGNPFHSLDDLSHALAGNAPRVLRLEFLRGDYAHIRRVSVQLGTKAASRSSVAA